MKTEKIEQLRREFNERIDALLKEETYEPNKWYRIEGVFIYVTKFNNTNLEGYGFTRYGNWIGHGTWCDDWKQMKFIPATDKEVEDALIAEAKKRGFKEVVKLMVDFDPYVGRECTNEVNGSFKWYPKQNELSLGGRVILRNGKWAKIIQDEVIKIGGYEVKFCGDMISGWTKDSYTRIDGNKFTKEFWQSAKIISEHSKAKIMVGCSKQFDVSLETINKILDKL